MFKRHIFPQMLGRLSEPRRFIQVLSGPRQVGKTTLARQLIEAIDFPFHYASADMPTLQHQAWIEQQWQIARLKAAEGAALLVLDEIHKIPNWSGIVKSYWDEDTRSSLPLQVMLLGSSPLLLQRGLTESLAGRFELVPLGHWSFAEMREAFGWNLNQYIYFGGYPGAAALIGDPGRWSQYIVESMIETTISRDILLMTRVDKPALLRRLFQLGCDYTGQVLSFQKMTGQRQDAGNTTTLAHYLELLRGAGFIAGLQKFTGRRSLRRASSPKLIVLNTALASAVSGRLFNEALEDREFWGRLVESAVGAHLVNSAANLQAEVFYWRERNREVDFVLRSGKTLVALEVKSGSAPQMHSGMAEFRKRYAKSRPLLVGAGGISLDEFFETPLAHWLQNL
jgi:predicted AAA+ superfamily ATPase